MSFVVNLFYNFNFSSAERVIAYAALETGARNPLSVACFIADGFSKDKCKVSCDAVSILFIDSNLVTQERERQGG